MWPISTPVPARSSVTRTWAYLGVIDTYSSVRDALHTLCHGAYTRFDPLFSSQLRQRNVGYTPLHLGEIDQPEPMS